MPPADDRRMKMLNKENVLDYLVMIAGARNKLIEEMKAAMVNYDGDVAALMSEFETEVRFDDHSEFRKLYTVTVPYEALELVDGCDVYHDDNWTRREIDIDGIHFEAYSYGKQADE